MKRYVSLFLLALTFCAILSAGCGGSSDSPDSAQSENLNEDTGKYDSDGNAPKHSHQVR